MPAVTTKLVRTKDDMRNGRKTGWPVSSFCQRVPVAMRSLVVVPGCMVESMIFFAFHNSGVISGILPVLYAVTSFFAFSRPADEVRRVLLRVS